MARRGRPTHRRGVAGAGRFVVARGIDLPPNAFFAEGRVFRAVVRHGNVMNDDDAGLDIRGAALRLVDLEDPDAPGLDLLMNTGVSFSDAWTFLRYAWASAPRPWNVRAIRRGSPLNERGLRRFLQRDERAFGQFAASVRRAPSSFTGLHYHSQIVYRFTAHDGERRFCRFRMVADPSVPEEAKPDPSDRSAPWKTERRAGETRPHDYLRQEFRHRLSSPDGVRYQLQMQLWEPPDTNEIDESRMDPGAEWEEPWITLGEVHLRRRVGAVEAEQLWFNLEHMPPQTLDLLESFSMRDPYSVAWTRMRIYRLTQAIRSSIFWNERRRAARVRDRDLRARGTHGLTPEQRRRSSLFNLLFSHMRR